jgi:predicted aspartyl protease
VIDTGAPHTVIFRDTARLANLLEGDVLQAGTITGVGTRNVHADLRLSAPVVIGDLTVMNMPVVVADQRHPSGVDMLLGYDFVTRTHLWIARAAKMLIMQYPPRATPAAKE